MLRKIIIYISLALTCLINNIYAEDKMDKHMEEAIFAMGCFWCAESEFRDNTGVPLKGIISARAGYAGGTRPNPTYHDHEGYKEAIKIEFDPAVISYDKLLDIFWHNVDPFDGEGQFCDNGFPYTSVVFYKNEEQKSKAEQSEHALEKNFREPFKTEIIQATTFYDAEEYHQDYKNKNPLRYKYYRWNCGRDKRLQEIWGNRGHE